MTATTTSLLLLVILAVGAYSQSCAERCGVNDGVSACQCNSVCSNHHDCCDDYEEICFSCQNRCGEEYVPSKPCQCNDNCGAHGNCCEDYNQTCKGTSDDELLTISEKIFAADVNSVRDQLTLDYQGQGTTGDLAPGPLMLSVPDSALSGPTLTQFRQLLDNYILSVSQEEEEDAYEVMEQDTFLDAIIITEVMNLTESFLHSKNLLTGSLRDKLHDIWFTMYEREDGVLGSSGFEHVFIGELKDGKVSGLHNWVSFQNYEEKGALNYEGWGKNLTLGDKGEILQLHFQLMSKPKKFGSMFVGTSPEVEIAIYTICFLARPEEMCPVQMNGQPFQVQTWKDNSSGTVGSAYPSI